MLIDLTTKFGIIIDVEASRTIRQAKFGAAKAMIERSERRFDLKPTDFRNKNSTTLIDSRISSEIGPLTDLPPLGTIASQMRQHG